MEISNFNIEEFLSLDGYATDERVARRKTNDKLKISNTNEYFTPFSLVQYMSNKISEDKWNDPNSEFLEPSFGNGNFIVYIIYNKIKHGSTWEQALSHTWGVELLESNVKETHDRVIKLLHNMNIKFDESKAQEIMEHNLVCSNFFKWDFDNWCPIKENKCDALF